METGEKQPMTEREVGTEIMKHLPKKSLGVVKIFVEAIKIFYLFLFVQAA
jgi:hypothetical protein